MIGVEGHSKGLNREPVFLLIQAVLYVTFLSLDIAGNDSDLSGKVKYAMILLCFCYAFFAGKGTVRFLKTALFFTVIADLFLLILDYYLAGVLVFIIVQQLYSLWLCYQGDQPAIPVYVRRIVFQAVLSAVVCLAFRFTGMIVGLLLIVSVFYFICILTNVVTAARLAFRHPKDMGSSLYALGIFLFLLCDINVGLFNLSGFIALPGKSYDLIYFISSILMWTFYAPAQVLIAISSRYVKQHNSQKNGKSLCKNIP